MQYEHDLEAATCEASPMTAVGCWISSLAFSWSPAVRSQPANHPSPIRTDSAGVEIVEHLSTSTAQRWLIGHQPVVEVGNAEGDSAAELYQVRGTTRTSTGNVIVINGASQSLKVFGADGKYIRTIGRSGSGPGEFSRISFVSALPGDSILVWDQSQQRLTLFDPDGVLVQTVPLIPPQANPVFLGMLPDGAWILVPHPRIVSPFGPTGPVVSCS